jgi:hypothetical protein
MLKVQSSDFLVIKYDLYHELTVRYCREMPKPNQILYNESNTTEDLGPSSDAFGLFSKSVRFGSRP